MKHFLLRNADDFIAIVEANSEQTAIVKFQDYTEDWYTSCEEIFVDDLELFHCRRIT